MALKAIDYECRPVNLLKEEQVGKYYYSFISVQKDQEYLCQVHPGGLVPALFICGFTLTQSLAIIDYLDQVYDTPKLIPEDPITRAKVYEIAFTIACDIHPLQNRRVLQECFLEPDRPNRARKVIEDGLRTVEVLLDANSLYSVGDKVTLADVVLVPQVYNAFRYCPLTPA